jgi:hypothetical protein
LTFQSVTDFSLSRTIRIVINWTISRTTTAVHRILVRLNNLIVLPDHHCSNSCPFTEIAFSQSLSHFQSFSCTSSPFPVAAFHFLEQFIELFSVFPSNLAFDLTLAVPTWRTCMISGICSTGRHLIIHRKVFTDWFNISTWC